MSFLRLLSQIKEEGRTIVGYGAPGKANTLLNYCGIRTDFIDFTVDRNPYKQGRFLPGTHIPIHGAPDRIEEVRPDYILVLPWNIQDEILLQSADARDWGARFIVPYPSPDRALTSCRNGGAIAPGWRRSDHQLANVKCLGVGQSGLDPRSAMIVDRVSGRNQYLSACVPKCSAMERDLLPSSDCFRESDEQVWLTKVPLVLRDLVLGDEVSAERVPDQLGDQAVVLVFVRAMVAEHQIGIDALP